MGAYQHNHLLAMNYLSRISIVLVLALSALSPAFAEERSRELPPPGGPIDAVESDDDSAAPLRAEREAARSESTSTDIDDEDLDDATRALFREDDDDFDRAVERLDKIRRDHRELSGDLDKIVGEARAAKDEADASMSELEERSAWKTFIIGPDFKNLGDLRSTIAIMDAHVRKLASLASSTPAVKAELDAQVSALETERTRLQGVVDEESSKFSLFGWLTRFLQ